MVLKSWAFRIHQWKLRVRILSIGEEAKNTLLDFGSDSMVLETNSSFGSTNSSISMSNLPPIEVYGEDGGINIKSVSSGSIESDNNVASAVSYPKTGVYQDQAVPVNLVDWLKQMVSNRNSEGVLDPKLPQKPSSRALKRALLVALRCFDPNSEKHPKMGHVVHMLETEESLYNMIESIAHGDEYDGVIFSQLVCLKSFMKLEHIFFFV